MEIDQGGEMIWFRTVLVFWTIGGTVSLVLKESVGLLMALIATFGLGVFYVIVHSK